MDFIKFLNHGAQLGQNTCQYYTTKCMKFQCCAILNFCLMFFHMALFKAEYFSNAWNTGHWKMCLAHEHLKTIALIGFYSNGIRNLKDVCSTNWLHWIWTNTIYMGMIGNSKMCETCAVCIYTSYKLYKSGFIVSHKKCGSLLHKLVT